MLGARRWCANWPMKCANLPSKFKILRSLLRLFTPGFLSHGVLAGQRQLHLPPIKLYLVCAAIFFLSAPVAGFTLESMVDEDPSSDLARRVSARVAERGGSTGRSSAHASMCACNRSIRSVLGGGAILIALLLQLLFRKQAQPDRRPSDLSPFTTCGSYLSDHGGRRRRPRALYQPTSAVMSAFALIVPYLMSGAEAGLPGSERTDPVESRRCSRGPSWSTGWRTSRRSG